MRKFSWMIALVVGGMMSHSALALDFGALKNLIDGGCSTCGAAKCCEPACCEPEACAPACCEPEACAPTACEPCVKPRCQCQVICEMKKVTKSCWVVEEEQFCPLLPGHCRPSRGGACDPCEPTCEPTCDTGCGDTCEKAITPPRCGLCRTKKTLVKKTWEVEVPVYKCVPCGAPDCCGPTGCDGIPMDEAAPADLPPAPEVAPAPAPTTAMPHLLR